LLGPGHPQTHPKRSTQHTEQARWDNLPASAPPAPLQLTYS
jgi:hypothetical protein